MKVVKNKKIPHNEILHYTSEFIESVGSPYLEGVDSMLVADRIYLPSIWAQGVPYIEEGIPPGINYTGHLFKGIPGLIQSAQFDEDDMYWFSDLPYAYLFSVDKWCGLHAFQVEGLKLCDFNNLTTLTHFIKYVKLRATPKEFAELEHYIKLFYGMMEEDEIFDHIYKLTKWEEIWLYDEPIFMPYTGKYNSVETISGLNPISHLKGRYMIEKKLLAPYYKNYMSRYEYDGLIQRQMFSKYDANGISLEEIILMGSGLQKLKEDFTHPAHWRNWSFTFPLRHLRGVNIPLQLFGCGKGKNKHFKLITWLNSLPTLPQYIPYAGSVMIWNAAGLHPTLSTDTRTGLMQRIINYAARSRVSALIVYNYVAVEVELQSFKQAVHRHIALFTTNYVQTRSKSGGFQLRHGGCTYSIGIKSEGDIIFGTRVEESAVHKAHIVPGSSSDPERNIANTIYYTDRMTIFTIFGQFGQFMPHCILHNPWNVWYTNIKALQSLKSSILTSQKRKFQYCDKSFTRGLFKFIQHDFTVFIEPLLNWLETDIGQSLNKVQLMQTYNFNLTKTHKLPALPHTIPNLAAVKQRYTGCNFGADVTILHEFYTTTNTNFQCGYVSEEVYDIELYGSPFNTRTSNFCSLFYLETLFGGLGRFEKYVFTPYTNYVANPPFDEDIIASMAKRLIRALDEVSFIHITVLLPVWDVKSRALLNLPKFNDKEFEGYELLMSSKYVVEHRMYGAEELMYRDYYKDALVPISASHLIKLKNY